MSAPSQPGPVGEPCRHATREDGVCTVCGHCRHEIVLNGACYLCGSTELDSVALSPRPAAAIIPAARLAAGKKKPE